jgi:hypothetical protein|tara:strand:- start:6 stop:278 length:273 start_codon:yes stop_codon:yes gene_type:complete
MKITGILPALMQLRGFLDKGIAYGAAVRDTSGAASPVTVAAHLEIMMRAWNPRLSGTSVIDDETRKAAARFLAGIAVNLVNSVAVKRKSA